MSRKILVVEDEKISQKLIKMLLQKAGYEIITASSGPEALQQANEAHPDLILLDILLPGMDGFHVCRYLRRHPQTSHLPIIMFSGLDRPADQRHAFEAGGDDYITKPIKSEDLLERVEAALYFKI